MKIRELFEDKDNGSLIGKRISGKLITKKTKNEFWDETFKCVNKQLTSLEGAPNKINGDFDCSGNTKLESLKGCSQEGVTNLYFFNCDITSLEGIPKKINGNFMCSGNERLKSLKGMPQEDVKDLNCDGCDIESLEGAPKKINGNFTCSNNKKLASLKGMPQEGIDFFDCYNCNLTSFEGAPRKIDGSIYSEINPITTLKGIHKIFEEINGDCTFPDSIESNILGLLKIKNLKSVSFKNKYQKSKIEISDIINKYLPNPSPSQIIDCQNELIDAGFEDYAEL